MPLSCWRPQHFLAEGAKTPPAASPFRFVCGKSALQAEITLLSRSCTPRGAGTIEFNAIIKPCCGFHSLEGGSDHAGQLCSAKPWDASGPVTVWMELGGFLKSLWDWSFLLRSPWLGAVSLAELLKPCS